MKRLIIPLVIILLIAALITAQEDESTDLVLSVSDASCVLELVAIEAEATPEATPDQDMDILETEPDWLPDLPIYTIGEDCEDIVPLLTVPSNGTLWLGLLYGDEWLPLDTLDDDPYPPQLDGRGRYFGCVIPDEGEQVCYVLVTLNDLDYLVEVPIWIGDAYYAPQPTATDEPAPPITSDSQTGGNDSPPPQVPQPTATEDGDGPPDGGSEPIHGNHPSPTPDDGPPPGGVVPGN